MSFLRKLFGGDPDTHRRNADALFERGSFGEAKLAYEKARDALPDHRRAEREPLTERIDACRDGIARAVYVARTGQRLTVLHVFTKKTQKTPRKAIEAEEARTAIPDSA